VVRDRTQGDAASLGDLPLTEAVTFGMVLHELVEAVQDAPVGVGEVDDGPLTDLVKDPIGRLVVVGRGLDAGSITGWSLDIGTTTADVTPPTVTTSTPTNKAANVTATFSEEVQNVSPSTFFLERKISVRKEPPKYVRVDATVSLINGSYELNPVEDLPKGDYRATITTDVTDMADNALEDPVVWTFKVAK
jgi:hypothetical protein